MSATAIYANRILTPQEELSDNVIIVEDGLIAAIGHRDEVRIPAGCRDFLAGDMTIVPGFVDVHIHGAGGHDVMEGNARALNHIAEVAARHGTTSLLATTVTASAGETTRSLAGIARYIREHQAAPTGGHAASEIVGVHLEGPFISHARRGVHPPENIVKPSIPLFEQLFQAADGLVRLITLAPEIPGALELIEHVVAKNIIAGVGHTDADYDQARAAFKAGARHAVHMFNAMRPFAHRDPGVIAAVLTDPEITAELIADGVHVAGPAMQVLLLAKGLDQVVLVSDGIAATGMRDGNYRLGTLEVTVSGGVARNSEGKLAGSTLTLDRALRTMVSLGVPLIDAVRMATLLPARRLGLAGKKGLLAVGADADLVALTPDLRVAGTMARGVGLQN